MVEIEYRPYQKIVVHEIRKLEAGAFLRTVVEQVEAQKQSGTPVINWVDGIAFSIGMFPPTPETIRENLNGVVHFAIVNFAETSFQEDKRAIINGREFPVKMRHVTDNPDFVELAKFLKSFKGPTTGS